MAIVACLQTNYGFRHHTMLQSLALIPFFKVSFASRILYQLVLWFTKMGVCIFYRRVFQDTKSKLFINLALGFLGSHRDSYYALKSSLIHSNRRELEPKAWEMHAVPC